MGLSSAVPCQCPQFLPRFFSITFSHSSLNHDPTFVVDIMMHHPMRSARPGRITSSHTSCNFMCAASSMTTPSQSPPRTESMFSADTIVSEPPFARNSTLRSCLLILKPGLFANRFRISLRQTTSELG